MNESEIEAENKKHSSPIPIPPQSPSIKSIKDNANRHNNGDTIITAITTNVSVYSTVEQMKRSQNYRLHSFKNISSSQVISLIAIFVMVLTFYWMVYRAFQAFEGHRQVGSVMFNIMYFSASVLYPVIFLLGLICYIVLSAKDCGIKLSQTPQNKSMAVAAGDSTRFWCYLCEEIRSIGTKHCYSCAKCVPHFDHHCQFLNTCIGGKNYSMFIVFCTLLEILCCIQVSTQTYVWHHNYLGIGEHDGYLFNDYLSFDKFKILFNISIVIPIIFGLSLLSLLQFHAYLTCKGLTTFEWILRKRQRESKKRLKRMQLQRDKKTREQNE